MNFQMTPEQQRLQRRCLELAADFATRSSAHDRDGSHPTENYDRLRQEGFLDLTLPKHWGGQGASFLDHTIAFEALGQGCPSTALAFNMHASVVMPILHLGLPDFYLEHGSREEVLTMAGLDLPGIRGAIRARFPQYLATSVATG